MSSLFLSLERLFSQRSLRSFTSPKRSITKGMLIQERIVWKVSPSVIQHMSEALRNLRKNICFLGFVIWQNVLIQFYQHLCWVFRSWMRQDIAVNVPGLQLEKWLSLSLKAREFWQRVLYCRFRLVCASQFQSLAVRYERHFNSELRFDCKIFFCSRKPLIDKRNMVIGRVQHILLM